MEHGKEILDLELMDRINLHDSAAVCALRGFPRVLGTAFEHVATIFGRWRCEFSQHRNPRIDNDNGGAGRAGDGQQAATALLFGFDCSNDPDHFSSDGYAYYRSIRMGFGVSGYSVRRPKGPTLFILRS